MTDLERHARSKWEWGTAPPRSALVREAAADPEPAKRHARKDRRRWCRGKPGVEHQPAVAVHGFYGKTYACGWRETGHFVLVGEPVYPKGVPVPKYPVRGKREFVATGHKWWCYHELRCESCGKWLGQVPECPDYVERASD